MRALKSLGQHNSCNKQQESSFNRSGDLFEGGPNKLRGDSAEDLGSLDRVGKQADGHNSLSNFIKILPYPNLNHLIISVNNTFRWEFFTT